MIENGKTVSVNYTGKLTNGEVFDSSEGREPLSFTIGSGEIIPGFEKAIIGKNIGDKVTVHIQPDDAYGQKRDELIVKVDKTQMPGQVHAGMSLQAQGDNGQSVNVTVVEVLEDHVMIDGNHPLAGQELVFDIEVINID